MMQRKYKPDGWLGMLLGSKFYVNFDGKYEFDEAYTMLNRELAGRSKDGAQAGRFWQYSFALKFLLIIW